MEQRFAIVLLGCLSAALIALGGCAGPAPSSEAAPEEAFPGVWEVVRLDDGQRVIEGDDLDRLRALDMHIYLDLSDDGQAVLRTFDEEEAGSWSAQSATAGTMAFPDGQQVAMELEGDVLSFSQDEDKLEFRRTDLAEMPPLADGADSPADEGEDGAGDAAAEGAAS